MEDQTQQTSGKTKKQMDDNVIFIGQKPLMNYVTAIVMQMTTKNNSETKIVARGRWMGRAVDVVELARNSFLKGDNQVFVKEIKWSSEKLKNKKNKEVDVSTIEIILSKK